MSVQRLVPCGFCRHSLYHVAMLVLPFLAGNSLAQEDQDADDEAIDEIVTVGSQIRGANISEALAVSVFSSEDIEVMGIESGDELLDLIPENGQNFLNDAETISGGVNAARGDIGAFNLRNMGTGNTLVLLNGRRLVNSAAFQTELIGADFVPVNSVNSNHIPVFGVERIEILRDGASAIYGADAVAGVVNTVLKNDFEGFTVRAKYSSYDHTPRDDQALSIDWGNTFNGGRTSVGVFARHYRRDRVSSRDEAKWFNSDLRGLLPSDSPYAPPDTEFRNDSANSLFGQFDFISSASGSGVRPLTDGAGEFETFPAGDSRCDWMINATTCAWADRTTSNGGGTYRYNLNDNRDLVSELDRTTLYAYVNHETDSGTEAFAEFYYYLSHSNMFRQPSQPFSSVKLEVGAQNYYNPFGPCTSPNRINPPQIGEVTCGDTFDADGLPLLIDLYRFAEVPRVVDNDGDAIRLLQGLRGTAGDWDWEGALTWSRATKEDITHNRISNTLMQEALNDPTPAAYNPFSGGINSNIERALVDVYRKGNTDLAMIDVKFSNPELFEMPAGPAGFLVGYELRRETFEDDRDPRLDGTIDFTDRDGDSYPVISDVMTSSPTPDGAGERVTNSLFTEFQLPLFETFDVQLAVRYEDLDDVGDTTVGKVAFGWRPIDQVLVRGSWSEAFRAPNLVTINESFIARAGTRNDWLCFYAADQGGLDPDDFSDCDYGVQRQATGSKDLKSEQSTNFSVGLVVEPIENLTVTLDYWSIEKTDTIGLIGRENQIYYDLLLRLEAGTGNATIADLSFCDTVVGNTAVTRDDADNFEDAENQSFLDAGLCPIGEPESVLETYLNLDTRTIEGHDIGVYYDFDTRIGSFSFRYNGSFYDKYEQTDSSPITTAITDAKAADPTLTYPIIGIGDLLRTDGNQQDRQSASLSWRNNDWGASVSGFRIGSFFETLGNEDRWFIPSMTTYNAKIDYSFDVNDVDMRVRFGVNNLTDERAPLSDSFFGYFSDAHRDLGVNYYVDLRASF